MPRLPTDLSVEGHLIRSVAAHEPIADLAAHLGHTDPSFTTRVYAPALPDRGQAIARRVDENLG
jgi:integrase